jgi:hypothetical protein
MSHWLRKQVISSVFSVICEWGRYDYCCIRFYGNFECGSLAPQNRKPVIQRSESER